MSADVATAFQQVANDERQKLSAALDILHSFAFEQERRDELNGGDLVMTELRLRAQGVLRHCGRIA